MDIRKKILLEKVDELLAQAAQGGGWVAGWGRRKAPGREFLQRGPVSRMCGKRVITLALVVGNSGFC